MSVMQVKTAKQALTNETDRYLRIAAISNKSLYRYLYIGDNQTSFCCLLESFKSGVKAKNLEEARSIFNRFPVQNIDVIILDTFCNREELRGFHSFLKNRDLQTIPVIYNARSFSGALRNSELVDDIVDLDNFQFDLSNKINFLKKSKEYDFGTQNTHHTIEPSMPVSKRLLDLVIASMLILFLLPLFLIIAIAIKIESKGPVFYNAKRAGKGFKIFNFYKFRTMVVNADKKIKDLGHLNQYNGNGNGPQFFKISNDPRITKVGRFLRNTSMDELPQLFNVLKGNMSIVGNRPLPLYEAATLTTNEFVERFMAPAGMTGLWQIKKRGQSDMSTEERISLDISYARKSNLVFDLWIMAHTPKALIQSSNV